MHWGKAELQACSALPCWSRPGAAGAGGLLCCQVHAQLNSVQGMTAAVTLFWRPSHRARECCSRGLVSSSRAACTVRQVHRHMTSLWEIR